MDPILLSADGDDSNTHFPQNINGPAIAHPGGIVMFEQSSPNSITLQGRQAGQNYTNPFYENSSSNFIVQCHSAWQELVMLA
jgi:hypothetical protein